jgi:hypothetical protein
VFIDRAERAAIVANALIEAIKHGRGEGVDEIVVIAARRK